MLFKRLFFSWLAGCLGRFSAKPYSRPFALPPRKLFLPPNVRKLESGFTGLAEKTELASLILPLPEILKILIGFAELTFLPKAF